MARTIIPLPSTFSFSCTIPVRISDLNYGGHVGNDTVLTLIHEARMQFLSSYGYSEKNFGGAALIMGDVSIVFRNELFYGDSLRVSIAVSDVSRASFDLVYKLEKDADGLPIDVAHAKTGMVCFDYGKRKVTAIPVEVQHVLSSIL